MKKRIISMLLVVLMIFGMVPVRAFAAADLPVSGNVVDIDDYNPGNGFVVEKMTVSGANVLGASQDGTTIDIILAADTSETATITLGFSGTGMLNPQNISGKLQDGELTLNPQVLFMGGGRPVGGVNYTVHLAVQTGEPVMVTPPTGEGFTYTSDSKAYKEQSYAFRIVVSEGYNGSGMQVSYRCNGEETILAPLDAQGNYQIASLSGDIEIIVSNVVKKEHCNVTLTEGEGYTITSEDIPYKGEDYTFCVTVDEAYNSSGMTVLAGNVVLPDDDHNGIYTIPGLQEDVIVTVTGLVRKTVCRITPPEETASFTFEGTATVYQGESYTFTITVDPYYDGSSMIIKAGEETLIDDNQDGVYIIPVVNGDIAITVEGITERVNHAVTRPMGKGFTFDSDNAADKIIDGTDYSFTVKSAPGYTVSAVLVNGEPVSGSGGSYTVSNVTEDLLITVTAIRDPLPERTIPVADGVVDIDDKQLYYYSSNYNATANKIKISGAEIKEAYQANGSTTIYMILPWTTSDTADITVEFQASLKNSELINGTATIKLEGGEGGQDMTVTGKRKNNSNSKYQGSAVFTVVFFREEKPTNPPICKMETDSKSIYIKNSIALELDQYFTNANAYYLVDSEAETPVDGNIYTYYGAEAGTHTLTFGASNNVGKCAETITVTIEVKEVECGVYINHVTGNGSMNYIQFADSNGALIQGVDATYDADTRTVTVALPKNYTVNGSVKAVFNLTQNNNYPFLSTSTDTTGNRAYNSRFTEKPIALTGGAASFTFYYYNSSTNATNNGGQTKFTIHLKMKNDLPVLAGEATAEATITAGENYTLDLAPLFMDVDGDDLTYLVSINGAAAIAADADYCYTTDVAGIYTLVFTANDGKDTSVEAYTVTLTVENVKQTDSMTVNMPEGLTPQFYVSPGFDENGSDQQGDPVEAVMGESADGVSIYVVNYPKNATMLSVRTDDWGGMAFAAEKDSMVTLRQMQLAVVDYENQPAETINTIFYGDGHTAATGTEGWLLVTGVEYTYTAEPKDTTILARVTETAVLEPGADMYIREMMLNIQNPMAITVPTGAVPQLYKYNQYYSNTELDAKIITINEDNTTTYQFVADTKANGAAYIYRVSMDGKITKAGWLPWGTQNLTVTYSDSDKTSDYRLDDYSGIGTPAGAYMEDSVLLNINRRNHLSLSIGQTRLLKAYRAWEIIPVTYNNYIIPPDFTYTILSGRDVVSLTEAESASAASGDWMTLTALKEGIAVIEVTYDAIDVAGDNNQMTGTYGASDPARSGLVVVQVGGSNDTSVNFGIDCFTSIGKAGSKNISYNPNNRKAWDAEFDTLYFTGSSGELNFSPTTSGTISEVAISHDKGESWNVLSENNGTYTAAIISGNNILRVKTTSGTAYQVVRGDRISVSLREVEGKSDGDGTVEAGETVRVILHGLHNPIPKMAGNYNPGYTANDDGYSSQHLNYMANGEAIFGPGAQYNFITAANYVDVEMPEDGSSVMLTDGYIGLGVIGLTGFADGGDSHRNIPDNGCGTRGSQTTYHTRSILPEITVDVGDTSAPNAAPVVRADAATEGSIYSDQKYAINPDTLFRDPDGNTLTFTVSVNGGNATEAGVDYKFDPVEKGTYELTFTASDGKESAQHTITLTVTERPQADVPDDQFDLEGSEIAGYVTISFEDNGVRVEGEIGLKFPVPLGTIIEPTRVPYQADENIAQVTKRLLDHLGIGMSHSGTLESGFYLGAIKNFEVDGTPYASMAEFDAGVGSGWMITQNGTFINQGASAFKVQDGDILKWQYTCQLGADIGDDYYAAVNEVIRLIDAIGTVTLDSSQKIQTARSAYDALTHSKDKVNNYDVLVAAEESFAELLKEQADSEDREAAEEVEKQIAGIGTVTLDSEKQIKAARAAYNALTATRKSLVKNLDVLETAEEALGLLKLAGTDIAGIYEATGDYLASLSAPGIGSTNGEWRVLGLSRAGKAVADGYYAAAIQYVQNAISDNGRLHETKSTDNSRLIIALTAIGKDVTDVGGHNLLAGLDEMEYIRKQGLNGIIWALIAFDTHNYQIPAGDVTREKLVQEILSAQVADGGWTLSGNTGDPDMTGMALQALAPYCNTNSTEKTAVDKALDWLSDVQNQDATFSGSEGITSESLAQVVTGLTALGINPESDSRFVKNGVSAIDALSKFYLGTGAFAHELNGKSDMMATEQAYYALVSYYRLLQDKTSLYNMSDVTIVIPVYRIIEGANSQWQKDDAALTIRADGAFDKFTGVRVDDAAVDRRYYTAKAGSTVVTFNADYLKTLSEGTHSVTLVFTDGEATTGITVLPTDVEAVNRVVQLIEAIGTVTKDSGDQIKAAREAYNKLTDDQKKLISAQTLKKLTDAEKKYEELVSTIAVSFTLLGCYRHDSDVVHTLSGGNLSTWIEKKTYRVEPGASVRDVLEKALGEAGMSWSNPTGNYVESISGMSEFTNGSNSGWMYTLNGTHPGLGVAQQTVEDGDVIVFHYTDDYTREEGGMGFGDDTKIKNVEELIDAIGTVTLNSRNKIEAARKAYDDLTYAQKQKVENYKKLTDAEARYAELKKADDEKKAQAVKELIEKLDKQSVTFRKDVKAAKAAYEALTDEQKKLVDNYQKLADALKLLASQEDREAAEAVETMIDAIGWVTKSSEDKIKSAREAYDKLTDEQKVLVGNLNVLEAAEAKLISLKALTEVEKIYEDTGRYLEKLGTPVPGSVGGEWMTIGLVRSGRQLKGSDAYYNAVVRFVQENINENGQLHRSKSTENARMILALTTMGRDVTDVAGHNLLKGLNSLEFIQKQGINGPIWALIAFDSGNYPVPAGDVSREALQKIILDAQLADGGWALSGTISDPDMTGMALQALAPYYETDANIATAVDAALQTLSLMQAADGSFSSMDGKCSESIAQVIVALSALGIDANTDPLFVKNGVSALDALCAFFVQGGGFKHIPDGKLDGMATEQSYYALTAYFRMQEGKTALFDMTDVVDMGGDAVIGKLVETLPSETVPADSEQISVMDGRSFPWLLLVIIIVLSCAIIVIVVILVMDSRPKKRRK